MTREEEIKQAAENNLDVSIYTPKDGEMLKETFYIGAKWADKNPVNVWHDASEEPKRDEYLLGEDYEGLSIYMWCGQEDSWALFVGITTLCRWAYISDLLPKGGEK